MTIASTAPPRVVRGGIDKVLLWSGGSSQIWQPGSAPQNTGNTAMASGYTPLIGDFVGAGGTDSILWYQAGSSPERLWTTS